MKFSYNWLKEYVNFKESPEKLAELLTLKSFEVEGVEKSGGDCRLNIALLPNRIPDSSGHIGLAREIAAIGGYKLKNEALEAKKYSTGLIRQFLDVKVENSEDCPRYMALMMDGVKVKESPAWLKQRLELCGLQSINNLVDAANYVMLETGQPLHVFDFHKIADTRGQNADSRRQNVEKSPQLSASSQLKSASIIVRRARKGEKVMGLDEKQYELNSEILVIADSEKPIAIAGIKGGKESGVGQDTRTIVLEAANFNQAVVRSGSKLLNLKTDASHRFEHGLDPNLADFAIRRLADLIYRLSGGNTKGIIDVYPKKTVPLKLLLRLEYANRLIGIQIPSQFYKNALTGLGMVIEEKSKSSHLPAGINASREGTAGGSGRWEDKTEFLVEIPTVRRDLVSEEDLIEEIARLYGYEKIPEKLPETTHSPSEENNELFWENKIKNVMVANGFQESFVYQFIGDKELAEFDESSKNHWELENPVSEETKYLTARPLLKYLKQVSENLRNFEEVKIFGIAKSFFQGLSLGSRLILENGEKKHLILAMAKKGVKGEEEFYELKGIIDGLLESLGIAEYWYDDAYKISNPKSQIAYSAEAAVSVAKAGPNLTLFHPYRMAEIKVAHEKIGVIGEIHPAIAENIKAKARIIVAEIDFSSLWSLAEKEAEYEQISKYPAVIRDIAVVVPFNTKTESILNIIENAGGELLRDTDLFDYFYDEKMKNKSQKSLAFHLKFESKERTLKDEEIDKIMQKIIDVVDKKGWIIR